MTRSAWAGVLVLAFSYAAVPGSAALAQDDGTRTLPRLGDAPDTERPPAAFDGEDAGLPDSRSQGSSYGYQLAIADGVLLPQIAVSLWSMMGLSRSLFSVRGADVAWFGLSYSLDVLGPLLIHGFNGASPGRLGFSLALRTVLPATFAGIGFAARLFSEDTPNGFGAVSFAVGSVLAAVLDDVLLGRDPREPPRGTLRRALIIVLIVASSLAVATLAAGTAVFLNRI